MASTASAAVPCAFYCGALYKFPNFFFYFSRRSSPYKSKVQGLQSALVLVQDAVIHYHSTSAVPHSTSLRRAYYYQTLAGAVGKLMPSIGGMVDT